MADFILLMHTLPPPATEAPWDAYLQRLSDAGVLRGGSAIGSGACFCKSGDAPTITMHLNGYIRIEAENLEAARACLDGNPVYESGGTVEIRELPRDN
jgi:hypothetical protein